MLEGVNFFSNVIIGDCIWSVFNRTGGLFFYGGFVLGIVKSEVIYFWFIGVYDFRRIIEE